MEKNPYSLGFHKIFNNKLVLMKKFSKNFKTKLIKGRALLQRIPFPSCLPFYQSNNKLTFEKIKDKSISDFSSFKKKAPFLSKWRLLGKTCTHFAHLQFPINPRALDWKNVSFNWFSVPSAYVWKIFFNSSQQQRDFLVARNLYLFLPLQENK